MKRRIKMVNGNKGNADKNDGDKGEEPGRDKQRQE